MRREEYKLENTLGKLIKELRDNNYEVEQMSDLDGCNSGLFYINTREEPNPDEDGYMIGEINLGNEGTELTLTIYAPSKAGKEVLSIAKKYFEKHHNTRRRESEHTGYKHHQWHNDGYRTARSRLTKSTPWKWKPKYTCDIDKHKIPPQ